MKQWLKKYGMTPGRAAIMAVLALALGVVWGPQLLPSKPELPVVKAAAPRPAESTARPVQTPLALPAIAGEKDSLRQGLPQISAEEAGAYDPFAPPSWSPAAVSLFAGDAAGPTDNAAERFQAIRSRGVAMILVSPDGAAAQLGDQTLRVGDSIDGFEVVDITAEGVVFKPAPTNTKGGVNGA